MWIVVFAMTAGAQALDPAPEGDATPAAPPDTIDCSFFEDAACETAKVRVATIVESLASMGCDKGSKKKREACRSTRAELELEKTELMALWAPPPAAEDEAAADEPMTRGLPMPIPPLDDGTSGKPVRKMEIDVSDE